MKRKRQCVDSREENIGREGGTTFLIHAVQCTLSTVCPVGDVCCWVQGYRGDALVGPPTGVTMFAVQLVMSSET